MNLVPFLLWLVAAWVVPCSAHYSTIPWASCAFEVIQQNAATVRHQVNAYALDSSIAFGRDLLDQVLTLLQANGAFSVNLAPYRNTVDFNHRNLVLIVADSLNYIEGHLKQLIDKNVEFRGYFLLLVTSTDCTATEVQHVLGRLWYFRIHNVLLAIQSGGTGGNDEDSHRIDLVSYSPYGPACCGCIRPQTIDRCVKGRLVDGSVALYDRFRRNLYGCQLRIAAFERIPFMQFSNGTPPRLTGIEGSLVELLAEKLNFTVTIVHPPDGRAWGRIYPNGTADGAMKLLLDGRVHMTLGRYFPYPKLLTNTTQSRNYYATDLVLAVPEALVPATPLEQLLKPFRWKIWLMLAMELSFGFGSLCLLEVLFPSGAAATSGRARIALDFWRSFIGESLPDVPRHTKVRFALMLWILHSSLLRECYKGGLVGFLTEPTPLTDIHSIEALLAAGYRFAMTETVYHKVFDDGSSKIAHRLTLVDPSDGLGLLQRTIQIREQLAIANTREEIAKFNERNRTIINYRTSDEKLLTFHFSMYFKRSSPVVTAFDWYIRCILATGHISHWREKHLDRRFLRPTLANSGQAEVLNLRHLLSSFMLLVGGLMIACLVFFLELFWVGRMRLKTISTEKRMYPLRRHQPR